MNPESWKKQLQRVPGMLLTEKQAAELLNLTPRALQAWRVQGRGPVFYKISGRAVRYNLSDIETWLAKKIRRSTSDPGPQDSQSD